MPLLARPRARIVAFASALVLAGVVTYGQDATAAEDTDAPARDAPSPEGGGGIDSTPSPEQKPLAPLDDANDEGTAEAAQPGGETAPASDAEPAARPPVAAPAPLEEVVVRATVNARPPKTVTRAEIRQMPGALGDPLRSVESLPGVSPTISGLPYFYVRGAPPNTVGFMLDDIQLPYVFHVGLGPSIVHPAFVRSVSIESAGGPPRLGRYVGSFVTATTNDPVEETTWEARLRVIDSSAFVETPFSEGRGHAAIGATKSYANILLNAFAPGYSLDYRDLSTRVTYDVGPRDHLTMFALGSYDFASQRESGKAEDILFASEIYRVDLKWQHDLDDGGELRVGTTFGHDRSRLVGNRFARDQSAAARAVLRQPLGKTWNIDAGLDTRLDAYAADLPSKYSLTTADYAETSRVFGDHLDTVTGAHASLHWRPLDSLDLMMGGRSDVYTSMGRVIPTVEPRTSLAFSPARGVRFLTAHGIAHQTPAYLVPIPALAIPGLAGGLQESLQSSVTAEILIPFEVLASATAFRGRFANLSDFVLVQSEFPLQPGPGLRGESHGLELSAKRALLGGFGMQVAYTLSRTTRHSSGSEPSLGAYDRTHVFNVALMFDLGRGFTASARLLTYTGLLRDPQSGASDRLPSFTRLDARLAKRWKWGKGYFGLVLEALNATASTETVAIRCDDEGCTPRTIGPITMPSLGIEAGM